MHLREAVEAQPQAWRRAMTLRGGALPCRLLQVHVCCRCAARGLVLSPDPLRPSPLDTLPSPQSAEREQQCLC